jgi:hypothetical protein
MRVAELRSFAAKFHLTVETTVKRGQPCVRVTQGILVAYDFLRQLKRKSKR